jgi:hypothetical protein
MAIAQKQSKGQIQFLEDDESRQFFDSQARRLVGMNGEEFIGGKLSLELRDSGGVVGHHVHPACRSTAAGPRQDSTRIPG